MKQDWNRKAAWLLSFVLLLVCGCGGYVNTPDYTRVEYNGNRRFGSDTPSRMYNATQVIDELTRETNEDLAANGLMANLPLVQLDYGGSELSPLEYSYAEGEVFNFTSEHLEEVRMRSTSGNVSFIVFNFNHLPETQYISFVEVLGDADFIDWRNEGFYFGMRQGGATDFSWSTPAGGRQNWIFAYGAHHADNYQGGIPSVVIAIADGDLMRIRGLRVVVSNVDDNIWRSGYGDPHFTWPYTANKFYNPGNTSHFFNGHYTHIDTYHDDYWPKGDYQYDRLYDDLNDSRYRVIDLEREVWELENYIDEKSKPTPVVDPPPEPVYLPAPVIVPDPVVTPTPVLDPEPVPTVRTVPVL